MIQRQWITFIPKPADEKNQNHLKSEIESSNMKYSTNCQYRKSIFHNIARQQSQFQLELMIFHRSENAQTEKSLSPNEWTIEEYES